MAPNEKSTLINEVHFDMKKLPSWTKLSDKVKEIEANSSWYERYGKDWLHVIVIVAMVPGALQMLKSERLFDKAIGIFILGCYHCIFANKSGHIAAHNGMCESKAFAELWGRLFVEFTGAYSYDMAYEAHIKCHHPHTNIIGLGDSSIWKVPQLSRITYMFFAPLLLPIVTPFFSCAQLIQEKLWKQLVKFIIVASLGFVFHIWMLVHESDLSIPWAIACLFSYRAVMAIPYIHINIFQHIGLPMYSQKHRPARIYQMASGVLNLESQWLLNRVMGHSLISCHVEHHLFPRLSDNMCLKIKPLVKEYLLENDLPYNEDSYMNRLKIFVRDYDELMVNAPPITHFIGIQ